MEEEKIKEFYKRIQFIDIEKPHMVSPRIEDLRLDKLFDSSKDITHLHDEVSATIAEYFNNIYNQNEKCKNYYDTMVLYQRCFSVDKLDFMKVFVLEKSKEDLDNQRSIEMYTLLLKMGLIYDVNTFIDLLLHEDSWKESKVYSNWEKKSQKPYELQLVYNAWRHEIAVKQEKPFDAFSDSNLRNFSAYAHFDKFISLSDFLELERIYCVMYEDSYKKFQ